MVMMMATTRGDTGHAEASGGIGEGVSVLSILGAAIFTGGINGEVIPEFGGIARRGGCEEGIDESLLVESGRGSFKVKLFRGRQCGGHMTCLLCKHTSVS